MELELLRFFEMKDFPSHVLQLVRSPPFHAPEAWKKYSIRTEPSRIVHPAPTPHPYNYFPTKND